MASDPEFAKAVDEAEMHADEAVEDAMYQAACAGNVVAGQVWLYNRRPERWADKRQVNVNASVGISNMSEEQLAERERRLGLPSGPIDASDLEGDT